MYIRSVAKNDPTRQRNYYYCASALPKYGPRCNARTIQQTGADEAVERIVSTKLLDAAFLKAILGNSQGGQPSRNENAAKLARERAKLEAERQELLRLTLKKICTEDDFTRESKRIEGELQSLDALMPEPLAEAFDSAKLVIQITRAFARFAKQPFEKRRGVLQAAVREVVVEDGAIPSLTLNGSFLAAAASVNSSTLSRHPCVRSNVPRLGPVEVHVARYRLGVWRRREECVSQYSTGTVERIGIAMGATRE